MNRLFLLIISPLAAFAFAKADFGAGVAAAQQADEMIHFTIINSKAMAEPPRPAARPYRPVPVSLPVVADDPELEAFRSEIVAVAKSRVYVELERLVAVQGFFWDRDFTGSFSSRQPAVDNLAAALGLERSNGRGWASLARLATEKTIGPLTGRLGILCAPGEPGYDGVAFDQAIDAARSTAQEWSYLRADKTAVRAAPKNSAAVVDTLGTILVRVLEFQSKDKEPESIRAAWARVATPAGKIGFVAPGALAPLAPERLCFGKDGFGRWRIAGFVSGD
jgi:hypothetical protein